MFPRLLTPIVFTIFLFSSLVFGQSLESKAKATFYEARALAAQSDQSKLRLALEKFQEAARLFRQAGVTFGELASKLGAASVAEHLNEHRLARDLSIESLPLFDAPEHKHELPNMLFKIGQFSLWIEDRVTAVEYFTRLAPLYEQLGQVGNQAMIESDLGAIYYELGKYNEALKFFNFALKRRLKLGNQCDIAATTTNIGAVHAVTGQWTAALEVLLKQALPRYNASPECVFRKEYPTKTECPNNLAATLINIGKVYYDIADYKSARCFYERAEPLVTEKRFKAALFNNLGTIEYAMQNYPRARARFQAAMKLHVDIATAEALTNIGKAQAKQSRQLPFVNFEAALRLRREIGNENGEAATLNSLAELSNKLAKPRDALANLNRAIPLFRSAGDSSGEATALSNAMISWRMLGNRMMAISNGKLAVEQFQKLRIEARGAGGEIERTYLRTVRQAYQNLAELLIEEGLHEQAIEVMSLYRDTQSFARAGDSKVEITKIVNAQQTLARSSSFRAVTLYTLIGDRHLHILAVTRDGIKVFARPVTAAVVHQKVKNFLDVLQCAERSPYQAASELYDLIFRSTLIADKRTSLETVLKNENASALLWSLDQPLHSIPIAALYNGTTKEFLIENYQIAVFTRNDAEIFTHEPTPWLNGIGLGTSIQFTGREPIPDVEASLAAIFGDEATNRSGVLKGKVVINQSFTAEVLENLKARWPLVHFMTHFVFEPGNSQESYLVLGNKTTYSLAQMRQQPNLFAGVELLAIPICESAAQSADAYGKEIEAFADLAQHIGAKSVIGSVWKVSYHVTPKMMLRFYELARANQDWSKAELLRQAQLALLRGEISIPSDPEITRGNCGSRRKSGRWFVANTKQPFQHPFYWSAFVLYGAPR